MQIDELRELLKEAHRRGDRKSAEALILKIEAASEKTKARTVMDRVIGAGEAAASVISGALTEPIAGIAGLGTLAANWRDPNAGIMAGETVDRVRREGAFGVVGGTYAPRTDAGREYVSAVGRTVAPVGEAFDKAGKFYAQRAEELISPLQAAGLPDQASAAIMAASETIPTAAATLAGYKANPSPRYVPQGIPEGRAVVEAGRRAGIPVLTSDVKPPRTFLGKQAQRVGERIPVAGTGSVRAGQQVTRETAVTQYINSMDNFSYAAIVDDLKTSSNRVKRAAGTVLEQTGTKLDNIGQVPTKNTDAAIQAARATLSRPNVAGGKAALSVLDDFDTPISQPQVFTTLKENRTALSSVIDNVDPSARSQLPTFAKRQLESVRSAMTRDMDDWARANLTPQEYGKWKKANSVYGEQAAILTRSKIKRVLDAGDFTPESVQTMLFSRKPSEVQTLYASLSSVGRNNARVAIIQKVVDDLSRQAGGLTPNKFAAYLKRYEPQIGIFFKGKDAKQLEGLRRVLEATTRAEDAALATATGQEVFQTLLLGSAAWIGPKAIAAVGTTGALARIYESAPVRNALLRLASVPPGSPAFDAALLTASSTLAAAAQSISGPETEQQQSQQ